MLLRAVFYRCSCCRMRTFRPVPHMKRHPGSSFCVRVCLFVIQKAPHSLGVLGVFAALSWCGRRGCLLACRPSCWPHPWSPWIESPALSDRINRDKRSRHLREKSQRRGAAQVDWTDLLQGLGRGLLRSRG